MCASLLGNYFHAHFGSPDALTTIQERIAIIETVADTVLVHTDIALAEYATALMPIYPFSAREDNAWEIFVASAQASADTLIRACPLKQSADSHPPPLPHINLLADGPIFSEILMSTGHRESYICPICHGLSAFVVHKPRGFKSIHITISPYDSPMNPDPLVVCTHCQVPCLFIQLHGIFLCLTPSCTVLVCPTCNNIHAVDSPIRSTLCTACSKVACSLHTCYFDDKPIPADTFIQLSINTTTRLLESLPACFYHYSPLVLLDRVFEQTVYVKKPRYASATLRRKQAAES